ncbi:unnamed protein product [Paramecium sonneborni]|uniref:Uncharacterized protein n=1 Tax=Paramecium sonneborni TaxID=65129 RepID=A0A8S1NB63_9CILI|nr:unnamed protein product [Paramecium sonneborni]
MQNHQLYLILDINFKFLKSFKDNFLAILQCIKTRLGLQLCIDFHHYFIIYSIDTQDIYQFDINGETLVLNTMMNFNNQILYCIFKDQENNQDPEVKEKIFNFKITLITFQYFFNQAKQIFEVQKEIHLHLLLIDIQAQSEQKPEVLGNEELKLGMQLTERIVIEKIRIRILIKFRRTSCKITKDSIKLNQMNFNISLLFLLQQGYQTDCLCLFKLLDYSM